MRRLLAVLTAAAAAVSVLPAPPASAAPPPLTAITMPFDQPGYVNSGANDVSCPSVTTCAGIVNLQAATTAQAIATRTGGTWHTVTLPVAEGVPDSVRVRYKGLSCATDSFCVATGGARSLLFGSPVVAVLTGGTWATQVIDLPPRATLGALPGISCVGAGRCVAAGTSYESVFHPDSGWVEMLANGVWRFEPLPADATDVLINDVACHIDWCAAIGYSGGKPVGLEGSASSAAHWQRVALPDPLGVASVNYTRISCGAVHSCVAIGYGYSSGHQVPVIATRDEDGWVSSIPPELGGSSQYGYYGDVSCAGPGACVVLGLGSGPFHSFTLTQDGNTWRPATLPVPERSVHWFLDCPAVDRCVVTGFDEDEAFGTPAGTVRDRQAVWVSQDGEQWATEVVPSPHPPRAFVTGVDCVTGRECRSIGYYTAVSGDRTRFTEVRTGSGWQYPATQPPSGAAPTGGGIACPSIGWCLATSDDPTTVARFSAGTWTLATLPPVVRSRSGAVLSAPSCSAVGECTMLWQYTPVGAFPWKAARAVAYRLSGGTWQATNIARLSGFGAGRVLTVSCPTATWCTALGSDAALRSMVTATYTGGRWTMRKLPGLPVGRAPALSCPTVGHCVAVASPGNEVPGTGPVTYTLTHGHWDGVRLRVGADTGAAGFTSVSCASVGRCTAVGYRRDKDFAASTPLVGVLTGDGWARLRPVLPADAHAVDLTSVSCVTPTSCRAVGRATFDDGSGYPVSLPIAGSG